MYTGNLHQRTTIFGRLNRLLHKFGQKDAIAFVGQCAAFELLEFSFKPRGQVQFRQCIRHRLDIGEGLGRWRIRDHLACHLLNCKASSDDVCDGCCTGGFKEFSLLELGRQVALLLHENKYSLKEISDRLLHKRRDLNDALLLAAMPYPIISAFAKPSEFLRTPARVFRWAHAKNKQAVIAEANAIWKEGRTLSRKQVFHRLWAAASKRMS